MHEMSITQSMVEICQQHAAGRRVLAVTLEIGALSGVVPEAVEFCFDACSRDTCVEGASLMIERVPGTAWCRACAATVPVGGYYDPCPACGAFGLEIRSGEELRVRELEIE